jgi:plastocyanin
MSRKIILVVIVALVAATLGIAGNTEKVKADTVNFTLYGSAGGGWGFASNTISSPGPNITVTQNDYVNLTLVSQDGAPHQFFVDYNNNNVADAGEPASPQFSGTIVFGFNATNSGNFTYRCNFHPSIMFGTFTVNQTVPEFSSLIILPFFAVATLLAAAIVYRTKRSQ